MSQLTKTSRALTLALHTLLCLWLTLVVVPAGVQAAEPAATEVLEVYVQDGCPYCAAAEAYLPEFARAHPGVRILLRNVDRDPQARLQLSRYFAETGIAPGVPAFRYRERLLVGFGSPESSGPELVALLAEDGAPRDSVDTVLFGTLSVERLGLPLFTLALGLLDGFNPCAMWVLLFLLSLLVHLHDRRRMALIAGTFVLASGAVYYAFMAAWLNLFLMVGFTTTLRILLGVLALLIAALNLKDYVLPGHGVSLSIPAAAKPGLYARMRAVLAAETLLLSLSGVAVLAVVVNFIELLCTAGFPALYTAVLAQQGLDAPAYYGYLGLYILGYLFDDSVMVGTAVFAMSSRKLNAVAGSRLKLLSGVVMLGLGLLLLLRPEWLV
jgi:hypothetical protein